jgi:glyoxylate/hydroxypyruvate reductase A
MSALLLAITGWEPDAWLERFRVEAKGREVRLWPETGDPAEIDYACVWKQPAGLLATLPKLKAVFSLGAGVDHLLSDPALPPVPIVRIVDPDLTRRMTGYVALHVLLHQRRMKLYEAERGARIWHDHCEAAPDQLRVGILGAGVLGTAAVPVLRQLGFQVTAFSRSPKKIPGIETFVGEAGMNAFLGQSDILVCLLPLTAETRGILCYDLFRRLARGGALGGPVLINAGRGGLQVDADILRALDDGTLIGASLDVFEHEPLPEKSPFWNHPRVYTTPHNAASSDPKLLTKNVMNQIERFERGLALQHVVDRKLGY